MNIAAQDTNRQAPFVPHAPSSIKETGLSLAFLSDLAIKIMYVEGEILGYELADRMRLPHASVVADLLSTLKREQLCEVKGAANGNGARGLGSAVYRYRLTDEGRDVAREAMERTQYAGPTPVTLQAYNKAIRRQALADLRVRQGNLEHALSWLVLESETISRVGAAVNSRRSMFLFGPPGNGKTAIAESVGTLVLRGSLFIPYAVETEGEIIKVFDAVNHELVEKQSRNGERYDRRWVRIRRPVIAVGGEMSLSELDLIYERRSKYYEAPLQMKANGGLLLIDDFGRQQARPRDLLNRWIVPLEKQVDFLTLHTGQQIGIPFDLLIVFATNLAPKELVDEAFLRRIRHKIRVDDPTWDAFREIFKDECRKQDVPYNDEAFGYLVKEHYIKHERPKRGCHPRDLIAQIRDIARYQDVAPRLGEDLIDEACESYFVDL